MKFSAVIRKKKLPIEIKGIVLFFHVSMCPDKMTLHGYAALMKGMLTPSVPVPAPERAFYFP